MAEVFTDQTGRQVLLPSRPQRIVSLVPSQTELLYDLGLGDRIVGITRFCVHPRSWCRTRTVVGGTKDPDVEQIRALRPDLVIANKEENEQKHVEALERFIPVWVSDVSSLEDALEMMDGIGRLTGRTPAAARISAEIASAYAAPDPVLPAGSVLYLIWRNPYLSVGEDTFIHDMLRRNGLQNVCSGLTRYPALTEESVSALAPDFIFLSSEPYRFGEKHVPDLQALCPASRILLVDGEYFSWYGTRLLKAVEYFKSLKASLFSPR